MTLTGSDISIVINGNDYSTSISEMNLTGGEREYATKKLFGNNYKKIETGRTDYEVSFKFKLEDGTLIGSLFETIDPQTIIISGSDVNDGMQITYYNMLPIAMDTDITVEDMTKVDIRYTAPAYDKTNTRYNRAIE